MRMSFIIVIIIVICIFGMISLKYLSQVFLVEMFIGSCFLDRYYPEPPHCFVVKGGYGDGCHFVQLLAQSPATLPRL